MKRMYRACLLALFPLLLTHAPAAMATEGFLIGAQFMIQSLDSETKLGGSTTDIGSLSPGGELFVGYGARHEQLNLALELFGNWTPENATYRFPPSDEKIKQKIDYSFGFRFKPGFYFDDTMLFYFAVGGTAAHFDVNSSISDDVDEFIWGFNTGVGMEKCVTTQLCVSVNYAITFYGSETEDDVRYIPRTSTFTFGSLYYFDF